MIEPYFAIGIGWKASARLAASDVIEEGEAEVSVAGETKPWTVGPGDYFGEIALINESPRTATLTAKTDMLCYGMTPWDFRPLVETNSTIAWKLLTAMADKMK